MKQWPRQEDNWRNKQQKSWQSCWLETFALWNENKRRRLTRLVEAILAYLMCIRGIFISPDVEASTYSQILGWWAEKGETRLFLTWCWWWVARIAHAELMICCQLLTHSIRKSTTIFAVVSHILRSDRILNKIKASKVTLPSRVILITIEMARAKDGIVGIRK